jgi:Uma2 family endonuclease
MDMATAGTLMSTEEFDLLPVEESQNFELFEGELVEVSTPRPKHSRIETILIVSLGTHLLPRDRGMVWPRTEFAFGSDRYQPDLAVFVSDRWKQWNEEDVPVRIAPDIAVEVISPSESAVKVERKRLTYLEHGVKEVWLIYSEAPAHIVVSTATEMRMIAVPAHLTTPLLPEWSQPLTEIFSICL